jgi:hypothetical protein
VEKPHTGHKIPFTEFEGKCYEDWDHSANNDGNRKYNDPLDTCLNECVGRLRCTGVTTYTNGRGRKQCLFHNEAIFGGSMEDEISGKTVNKAYSGRKCYRYNDRA